MPKVVKVTWTSELLAVFSQRVSKPLDSNTQSIASAPFAMSDRNVLNGATIAFDLDETLVASAPPNQQPRDHQGNQAPLHSVAKGRYHAAG